MQKDFHFYAFAILARAAGFDAEDAVTIGHAPQYDDNSTESELIKLDINGSDMKFDPVRSAHDGLEIVNTIQWSAQYAFNSHSTFSLQNNSSRRQVKPSHSLQN